VSGCHGNSGSLTASMSQSSEVYPMLVAMKVNFNTAKLFFNTLPLRGLRSAQDISPMKLHYIQQSGAL
jgi:hypothetical protein